MTAAETKAAAEVMLAWADGKPVECRRRDVPTHAAVWREVVFALPVDWDFRLYEFRIKPQPREWWIVRAPSYGDVVVSSEESAKEHVRNYCRTNAEIIHVREVI